MRPIKISRTFSAILLAALPTLYCGKEKITDETIGNYVKAYQNLAARGPELSQKLGGAEDGSKCDACEPILEEATTRAGFEDYETFLKTDERVRSAASYIQLNEMFGKAGEGMSKMTDEKNCMAMLAAQKDLTEAEKKEKCDTMKKGMGVAQGAMGGISKVMSWFVDEEDVEAVRPHVSKVNGVINNKALPCQFDFACPEKNINLEQGQM